MRVFDCVILDWWGEMGLLEKRFTACQDNPDVTHVICEAAPAVFPGSDLAARWRGRWNHVKVEEHEITGDRQECLRDFLMQGVNGDPDDLILFSGMKDIPGAARTAGAPR